MHAPAPSDGIAVELDPARAEERAHLMRPGYRGVVLGFIVFGFALNFLDRQILSILMQPIKEELQLSDTALGFLSGLAFAIFYATMGIPVSRLADRGSRRAVMAASMAIWSAATAVCGLAQNFIQLFLSRVMVGIGEAGFTPSGFAMVSDYFPKHRRGTAIGIVNTGPMIGTMLGFVIGGWAAVEYGWRAAFVIAGVPGIIFALLFWLVVREPWRGMADGVVPRQEKQLPMLATFGTLWRIRSYRFLIVGAAFSAFGLYGVSMWMPSFLARSHGMTTAQIGVTLGPLIGVIGGFGMFLGGYLTDRLARSDDRWAFWMPSMASVASIPVLIAALFANEVHVAIGAYALVYLLNVLWVAPTFSVIQQLVPATMRVTATAWKLLATNLIGLGLGPQLVGVVSDLLAPSLGDQSLRYSMLTCSAVLVLPTLFYLLAARSLQNDLSLNQS